MVFEELCTEKFKLMALHVLEDISSAPAPSDQKKGRSSRTQKEHA
jgi:hypothetical protein